MSQETPSKRYILDIETDDLDPKYIWVIVTKDVETGDVQTFCRPDVDAVARNSFVKLASDPNAQFIGHNIVGFDFFVVIRRFFPGLLRPEQFLDTLIVSRLLRYDLDGGHSLASWGKRLGLLKPVIEDFSRGLSPEIIHRCIEDVEINYKLYKFFEAHIQSNSFKKAIELEHRMACVCLDMETNGFHFNIDRAKELYSEIDKELENLDRQIQESFKPRVIPIKEILPRATKSGGLNLSDFRWVQSGDLTPYSVGHPFTLIEYEPFNPASPKQIVERLNQAGWKPVNKTKGYIKAEMDLKRTRNKKEREELKEKIETYKVYGWKIDEENLSTLPEDAPEPARKLAERILLASRRSVLNEWMAAYRPSTGRIHGRFNHIGAWTHRMSHQKPNQGNIPSDPDLKDEDNPTPVEQWKLKYSKSLRALWGVPKGKRLIGVDADQIQLRIFAHYINDPNFIKALVDGDKALGTDVHSLNGSILDRSRQVAKTFIYAFLLGVGVDKASTILHTSNVETREKIEEFIKAYPGLQYLKETIIPKDAQRGYFEGIDGRKVVVPSEHHVLAGYLQNGESVIMKAACVHPDIGWRVKLKKEKIPFKLVDFVHDEWQTEVEDDDEVAEYIGKVQSQSIVEAGQLFNLRCPTAGQLSYHNGKPGGYNWSETH